MKAAVLGLLATTAGLASAFVPAPMLPKGAAYRRGGPVMSVQVRQRPRVHCFNDRSM